MFLLIITAYQYNEEATAEKWILLYEYTHVTGMEFRRCGKTRPSRCILVCSSCIPCLDLDIDYTPSVVVERLTVEGRLNLLTFVRTCPVWNRWFYTGVGLFHTWLIDFFMPTISLCPKFPLTTPTPPEKIKTHKNLTGCILKMNINQVNDALLRH